MFDYIEASIFVSISFKMISAMVKLLRLHLLIFQALSEPDSFLGRATTIIVAKAYSLCSSNTSSILIGASSSIPIYLSRIVVYILRVCEPDSFLGVVTMVVAAKFELPFFFYPSFIQV